MTIQDSSNQKTFKNTFAPHIGNKVLTVHGIIAGLKTTLLHSVDLPPEVQKAVVEELKSRSAKNQGIPEKESQE